VLKKHFFKLRTQVASEDPYSTLDQKMPKQWPPLKFDFEGGWAFLYPECLTLKLKNLFFSRIFFPLNQAKFFSKAKNLNVAKITPWRINLSLKKYTFCDNWTKIVAQSWFGARIYPRVLSLGCWPLNFRIKIPKYTFSLVFVKKNFAQSDQRCKR
jgi:hypothetical protein